MWPKKTRRMQAEWVFWQEQQGHDLLRDVLYEWHLIYSEGALHSGEATFQIWRKSP